MKKAVFIAFVSLLSFFQGHAQKKVFSWDRTQQNRNGFSKDYIFEAEYQYISLDKDTDTVRFMFSPEKFLKVNFGNAGEFILIDVEDGFIAADSGEGIHTEKIADLPPLDKSNYARLERKGEIRYNGYNCDVYHINLNDKLLKFYFEKQASDNFNPLIVKLLMIRGLKIDEASVPRGKLIAGMEVKNGKNIDAVELAAIKENPNTRFTLIKPQ